VVSGLITSVTDQLHLIKFQHCAFLGRPNINTGSDSVTTTIILLKALQMSKDDIPLVRGDSKETVAIGVEVIP
jgi:hypothetical protein